MGEVSAAAALRGGDDCARRSGIADDVRTSMNYDVFISYSNPEQALADSVCGALEHAGCSCFIASRDLVDKPAGTVWADALVSALQNSRLMLVLYSRGAANSQHVRNELNLATDCKKVIFPVKVDDYALTNFFKYHLSNHQILQFDRTDPNSLTSLVKAVVSFRDLIQREEPSLVVIEGEPEVKRVAARKPEPPRKLQKVVQHITNRAEGCVNFEFSFADRVNDRVRLLATIGFGQDEAKTAMGRIAFGLNGGTLKMDLGAAAMPVDSIRFVENARVSGRSGGQSSPGARTGDRLGLDWRIRGGVSPRRPSWTISTPNPDEALSGMVADLELGVIELGNNPIEISARFEIMPKNLVVDSEGSSAIGLLTGNRGLIGRLLIWKLLSKNLDPFVVQVRLYYQ